MPQNAEFIWAPQPGSQSQFLTCPAFECLLHGTRGGGKTDAMLMCFAQHVRTGLGRDWRGIIFRRSFGELEDIIARSQKWFYRIFGEDNVIYNKQFHTWTWKKTGEELVFSYIEKPEHYEKHHGHEYPFVGWEELTQFPTPDAYLMMMTTVRSANPKVPLMVRSTTNPLGCVPFGEVLTEGFGWVDIKEMHPGIPVLSVDRNGRLCVRVVSDCISRYYSGEIIRRMGRGIFMEFTPDHRLPLLNTNQSSYELRHFYDLPGEAIIKRSGENWAGKPLAGFCPPQVKTRRRKIVQPSWLSTELYAAFMGWWLSEGSLCDRDKAIWIAQDKPEGRRELDELLRRCGFKFSWCKPRGLVIYAPDWWYYLKRFGKAPDKYVPPELLSAEPKILRVLLNALMAGDGTWYSDESGTYYTTSKQLSDNVAEIATKLGYRVFISSRKRDTANYRCYQVNFCPGKPTTLLTDNHIYKVNTRNSYVNVEKQNFSGQVYCLTVPETETFFIRQNGCVWLSGNSGMHWVKARFIDACEPCEIITDENGRTRTHIFSAITENRKFLEANPDYINTLKAQEDPARRKAWLFGSWDIVAGGIFDEIWSKYKDKIVVEPFPIPKDWHINRSLDWGTTSPFSVGWWAESNGTDIVLQNGHHIPTQKGDLFRIGEWYGWSGNPSNPNTGCGLLAYQVAQGILQREEAMGLKGRVRPGPADTEIWGQRGVERVADIMEANKVRWTQADKGPGTVAMGVEKIRMMMSNAGTGAGPGLFVFSTCRHFLRTVPVLPRSSKKPDEYDTKAEDHVADETRYRVLERKRVAKEVKIVGW